MVKPVKVTITNGDLNFAKHPVAVGHYVNDIITSAESRLNSCLDDRLNDRYRLGLYPCDLEEAEIFLNPDERARPQGAIVLGLGKIGELTTQSLAKSFANAALSYALAVSETTIDRFQMSDGGPRSAPITSLLIGAGAGGISIQDSLTAILRGVARANLTLQQKGYSDKVVLDYVEFLELWEDLAIRISRCMVAVTDEPELRGLFDCSEAVIHQAPGARIRVAFEKPAGWWTRLRILGDADGSLRFSVMTDRARSEVRLVATQRALVDKFIDTAIRNAARKERAGRTLFELLVPNALKERVPDRQDLVLVLNEESAQYPWELMQDQLTEAWGPLAVEAGVVRQLETPVYREKPLITSLKKTLVIGDHESSKVPLPSAQDEAHAVRCLLLEKSYDVKMLIRGKAQDIVETLFEDAYRILHLTGHGVYRMKLPGTTDKFVSGMVIGDDVFLTPADVEQMRQIPELVFINCCHLGRIEGERQLNRGDYNKLAANLAAQFIRMGVRAVVAAGWAVSDDAACTFAKRFYKEFLDGETFGRAVQLARKETYENHKGCDTWGAYQCYGDPGHRLIEGSTRRKTADIRDRFHVPREAVVEINNLGKEAEFVQAEEVSKLRDRLRKLIERIPGDWLKSGAARAALGNVCEQLDLLPEATTHYRAAIEAESADSSLSAIERMADIEGILGIRRWKNGDPPAGAGEEKPGDTTAAFDRAIALLEGLLGLGATARRYSLLGNAFKRKARVTAGKDRLTSLEQMRDNFKQAVDRRQGDDDEEACYARLNWLTAEFILQSQQENPDGESRSELAAQVIELEGTAVKRDRNAPSFRSMVAVSECRLIRALVGGDISEYSDDTLQRFKEAVSRGMNRAKMSLVLEDIDFLIEMTKTGAGPAARRKKHAAVLANLQSQLTALS